MPSAVVDTHTIIWYLAEEPKLSRVAAAHLDRATHDGDPIFVPAICLVEIIYLVEKGKLAETMRQLLLDALDDPGSPARLVPMDRDIVDAVKRIDRAVVPDMPDRIIAATALSLNL